MESAVHVMDWHPPFGTRVIARRGVLLKCQTDNTVCQRAFNAEWAMACPPEAPIKLRHGSVDNGRPCLSIRLGFMVLRRHQPIGTRQQAEVHSMSSV